MSKLDRTEDEHRSLRSLSTITRLGAWREPVAITASFGGHKALSLTELDIKTRARHDVACLTMFRRSHMKKIMAPIIVVVVVLAYFAFVISALFVEPNVTAARIIVVTIVTLLAGALVAVLIQRIKEIKKGEDDDLGEY